MLAAATLVGALTWTMPAAHGAPEKRSTSVDEPGVTANLWEWNWKSIGRECAVLAKDGYTGVQVAPPQIRSSAPSSAMGATRSCIRGGRFINQSHTI